MNGCLSSAITRVVKGCLTSQTDALALQQRAYPSRCRRSQAACSAAVGLVCAPTFWASQLVKVQQRDGNGCVTISALTVVRRSTTLCSEIRSIPRSGPSPAAVSQLRCLESDQDTALKLDRDYGQTVAEQPAAISSTSSVDNKAFVKVLSQCSSVKVLQAHFLQHADMLDAQSITAVISHARKLACSGHSRTDSDGDQAASVMVSTPESSAQAVVAVVPRRCHALGSSALQVNGACLPNAPNKLSANLGFVATNLQHSDSAGLRRELQVFVQQHYLPLLLQNMMRLDAGGFAIIAQSLACLPMSTAAAQGAADTLAQHAEPLLAAMAPRTLTQLLWGLVSMGYKPPAAWIDRFLATSRQLLHKCGGQDLSITLWCLARLGYVPSSAWLTAFLSVSARHLPHLNAQQLAIVLWGQGVLRCVPPDAWLDTALAAVQHRLQATAAAHLVRQPTGTAASVPAKTSPIGGGAGSAGAVAAVIRTDHKSGSTMSLQMARTAPPEVVVTGSCPQVASPAASATASPGDVFAPQGLAMLSHALITFQYDPGPSFCISFQTALLPHLRHASAQDLAIFAMAFANWHWPPPSAWMEEFCRCCAARWAEFTAQGLALLLSSCAQLRYRPPDCWMRQAEAALTEQADCLTPQGAAQVASALGRLGYEPQKALGRIVLNCIVEHAENIPAKRFFKGFLGLAVMASKASSSSTGCRDAKAEQQGQQQQQLPASDSMSMPTALQLPILLQAARKKLRYAFADDLGSALHACALLHVRPSSAWLSDFLVAVRIRLPLASAQMILQLLDDMTALQLVPPAAFMEELYTACQRCQEDCTPAQWQTLNSALQRCMRMPDSRISTAAPTAAQHLQNNPQVHSSPLKAGSAPTQVACGQEGLDTHPGTALQSAGPVQPGGPVRHGHGPEQFRPSYGLPASATGLAGMAVPAVAPHQAGG